MEIPKVAYAKGSVLKCHLPMSSGLSQCSDRPILLLRLTFGLYILSLGLKCGNISGRKVNRRANAEKVNDRGREGGRDGERAEYNELV